MDPTVIPSDGSTTPPIDQINALFSALKDQSVKASGAGENQSLYQTILSKFDRFGINSLLPNHEMVGYTFITRPKLNLSTTSLRQDRVLSMLNTAEPGSLQFAIRCYLDTYYSNRSDMKALVDKCPFFNPQSPFLIPLSNNIISLSGWPDPVLEPETTDGGFYSEDFTMVKGSDRLNRTYDINITFRDVQGGFIMAMLYMWIRYVELVVRGDTTAYMEDIAANRLNYTCSVYRFVMDPSRRFITKWSKATGCFPRSVPIGNTFNFGEKENFIHSSAQYSVPFTVNKIEIMDPIIFRDFNTIVRRFAGNIIDSYVPAPTNPSSNFIGIPYIDTIQGYNQLKFLAPATDLINTADAQLASLLQQYNLATRYNTPTTTAV